MVEFPAQDVYTAALRWDDQRVDLTSGGTLARDADSSGFTAAVKGGAAAFGDAWGGHLDDVAAVAQETSTSLDAAVTTWFNTDASVAQMRGFARWKQMQS